MKFTYERSKKIMIRVLIFFFLFGQIFTGIAADSIDDNYQRIIPLGSELYKLTEQLSLEAGLALLSAVKPWSEAEVINIINQLDVGALSPAGKAAYERAQKLIGKTPVYTEDGFALDASLEAAVELYLHTSAVESEWQYGYEKRLPVVNIPVQAWFNEGFYAYFEPQLKESRFLITALDAEGNYSGNLTNIPMSFAELNYYFPVRAFLSVGGENWNLQIGRDQLEYGNGVTGKLLLSSSADYYDFIKLKGFLDNFSFTWTYVNLESWASVLADDGIQRSFIDHVIEARIFDILTLYINESMLLYGQDPELQFINPLTIYHNFFIKDYSNSLLSAGFSINPMPGLNFYGEYALDQLQTAQEKDLYGSTVNSTPNADGHMLGVKGVLPLGQGYFSVYGEYVYTSPWLYLRSTPVGSTPAAVSFYWEHRELSDVIKNITSTKKPLGYKYGPDTIVFSAGISYSLPEIFAAGLSAEYVLKGENYISTAYVETVESAAMQTPTGTAENSLIINLAGEYQILPFLSARADLSTINITNYNHVSNETFFDFQTALSLIFEI